MVQNSDEIENYDDEEIEDANDSVDSIRQMIRDEIKAALDTLPGETLRPATQEPQSDEPMTMRAVEASVRRAVEDAMQPLREAQAKPKPKKKTAPKEVEPEPAPLTGQVKSKLQSFLWGDD